MAALHGVLLIELVRLQQGVMMCSMAMFLAPCLVALLQAVAALGTPAGPALSPTADSKHWTLQVCCWKFSSLPCVDVALLTCA